MHSDPEFYCENYYFARLNSNGSIDNTFEGAVGGLGLESTRVQAIALQPDGKILVGGQFGSAPVKGTHHDGIFRVHPNGTLDTSYNAALGQYASVDSIVVQSDARILIAGSFGPFLFPRSRYLARLNANGSWDDSLNVDITTALYGYSYSVFLQPDGDVMFGGTFSTVNGVLRPNLARLFGGVGHPTLSIMDANGFAVLSWPVSFGNFQLQENTIASFANGWSTVAATRSTNNSFISVALPISGGRKFFRLSLP